MNIFDYLNINGHVTIHKVLDNGTEELLYDDHNVIVSGFGVGLSHFFALSGSTKIYDYQIDRFQLGLSGATSLEVSSRFDLSSALTTVNQYTTTGLGDIVAFTGNQIKNGSIVGSQVFAKIPFHHVTRISESSVRYTLRIDKDSCNGLALKEVGLFMKNPRGLTPDASILVAYKSFSEIRKTSDFALVIRWTINL